VQYKKQSVQLTKKRFTLLRVKNYDDIIISIVGDNIMNNKKGFSLIELVSIIVIIGLILIVVVPAVTKLLKNNNTKQYEKYYEIVKAGALRYSEEAKDDLGGYNDIGCVEISLEDLIKEGYIKKFNDDKTTCTGTSRLINEKGKVSVLVDLSCKNKRGKTTYTLDQINDGACLSSYKVTITAVSNNTSYGTVSPESIELTSGEDAKFTITPATNYQYSHDDCGGTVSGNILTIPNVTESKTCTVTFVDNFAPDTPTITRKDYNTFTFTAEDNEGVAGYYITKDSTTKPTASASGWTTATTYDINGAGTYRVWAKDKDGNVSDTAGTITAYTISRSQGANTTLTTRYDSTSSSTGTVFSSNTVMLAGTSVWAKATASSGYTVTLKRGSTAISASGASFTVSSSLTITSSATQSCSCPKGGTLQSDNTCDITTTSSTTSCKSCYVETTKVYVCPSEDDDDCVPELYGFTYDYYGKHECEADLDWDGYPESYYCFYYDTTEYKQSCSECGSTTNWSCPSGTTLTYNGSSYGTCTYNATC